MTKYRNKYYIKQGSYTRTPGDLRPGRLPTPESWVCGSQDPIDHDKYYGWKKHHAQARHRGEDYALTWEDWQHLWPTHLWLKRGRGTDDYTMYRLNCDKPWSRDNVVICLQRDKGKYYQPNRSPGGRPRANV